MIHGLKIVPMMLRLVLVYKVAINMQPSTLELIALIPLWLCVRLLLCFFELERVNTQSKSCPFHFIVFYMCQINKYEGVEIELYTF